MVLPAPHPSPTTLGNNFTSELLPTSFDHSWIVVNQDAPPVMLTTQAKPDSWWKSLMD